MLSAPGVALSKAATGAICAESRCGTNKSAHVLASRKLKSAKVQSLLLKQIERLQAKREKQLDDYVAEAEEES
jgi:hypothetical protein